MALDLSGLDLSDLMSQTVDIEVRTTTQDSEGSNPDAWTVEESAVPCLIVPTGTEQRRAEDRVVDVVKHQVYFDRPVTLGASRRLAYEDPVRGTRHLFPDIARNAAEVGVVWIANAEETPS